jgi:hypothetical protein
VNEEVFWALIASLDWDETGDDDAVLAPVVRALSSMPVEQIFGFDDLLAEKLYTLDTRDIARGVYRGQIDPDDGDQYISADDFLYSRCAILANGKESFEATLRSPLDVPQDLEFEVLLSAASTAYEAKVGQQYEHLTPLSWESFSNQAGWKPTAASQAGLYTGTQVPLGNRRPS